MKNEEQGRLWKFIACLNQEEKPEKKLTDYSTDNQDIIVRGQPRVNQKIIAKSAPDS